MWRSDGALTVGWGETFCYIGGSPSQKRFKIFDLDLPQPVPPLFHSVPTVWDHRSLQIAILANLGCFWVLEVPNLTNFVSGKWNEARGTLKIDKNMPVDPNGKKNFGPSPLTHCASVMWRYLKFLHMLKHFRNLSIC